jgi:hypothetical protein
MTIVLETMTAPVDLQEAAVRLRLLQHAFSANLYAKRSAGGSVYSRAAVKERKIRQEVERLRAALLLRYRGSPHAVEVINELFRLQEWEKDVHPYSAGYSGSVSPHPRVLPGEYTRGEFL